MSWEEKRKYPRVPLDGNAPVVFMPVIAVADDQRSRSVIVNIAEEGLFLKTEATIANGTSVLVRFLVEPDSVCEARGTVVWQRDVGVGLRLPDPNDAFRLFVRKLAAAADDERVELLRQVKHPEVVIDTG